MNEKEARFNELNKELKLYNTLGIVDVVIAIVSAVFIILGLFIEDSVAIDRLFWVSVGTYCSVIIHMVASALVEGKKIDEATKLKKEIKQAK